MEKKILIAPSLLACQKGKEKEEMLRLKEAGADYLHFDVMDGKFVPNTSFSEEDYLTVFSYHLLPMDVHIMVEHPENYISFYGKHHARILTFHYEACASDEERIAILRKIRLQGMLAGISLKPMTPASVLSSMLPEIDVILVMSVEPGKGGQAFLPSSIEKIQQLRAMIEKENYPILLEVDGGINGETGKEAIRAGADMLVAGSYLFHKEDVASRIALLKEEKKA